MPENYDIKDIDLADAGLARILWADRDMPVLASIRERFAQERPLEGIRIGACMHVTTETANLMRALVASGAQVTLCASNPLSTQDDTAASLVRDFGIDVHAIAGEDMDTYARHIESVIATNPQIIMDDGADLDTALHTTHRNQLTHVIGGTEETTTGVVRLASMAAEGTLAYPVFNINDANTKHCFDNHYGTGQSTLDGIVRATNRLLCGRTIVISGYGYCGSGLALRAKGMGMNVIVCEVDPLKALEAHMEGHRVMKAEEAARFADVWVTVTGNCKVVDAPAFENMKDGAIVCNSGHFDSEINIEWLREHAVKVEEIKPLVEEYTLADGRTIIVLAQGRLVNLSCAEGHPASVMDMSFANQALAAEYLYQHASELENKVYDIPSAIDDGVARVKLETLGITIDTLTDEQIKYMNSWDFATA
ncbi:MAG: adenosylhomocysteinase [Gordonibacter sp.]|nr:adenosylhomocysteinase [Gordonibacter sp.]